MAEMSGLVVTECQRCEALCDSRTQIVNGVGSETGDLLFVGEAPGEEEDAEGEPFVGRSGGILTSILRDHGLDRSDVRITNCVRCRPPDNRDPTRTELGNCRNYLETEIEAIDPTVIVALGKVPAEHLLDRSVAVTNEAGTVETIPLGGEPREILISVHPAASLYDPSQRETLDSVIETAVAKVDIGGQTSLGEF